MNYENKNINIYKKLITIHGIDNVNSLGYGDKQSQLQRFTKLIEIGEFKENTSILDVGCGYGDLYTFIKNNITSPTIQYTGIDLMDDFVHIAKNKHIDKNISFSKISFNDHFEMCKKYNIKYDYILSSGIFSFYIENWNEYVKKTLSNMFSICNIGIAATFLSVNGDKKIEDRMYMNPKDMIDISSNITYKFKLDHTYRKNNFIIYLYK